MRLILLLVFGVAAACGYAQPPGGSGVASTPTPQWRPVYHFTPLANWTNDPNGPLFLHGEWLVYNQQNPFGNKWGHMSWGHAVSRDLVHWKHLPVAIPEKIAGSDTTWIFSGSAVWDEHNTSGFCKGGGCIVAIYTADQPHLHKESQYIAYSNDGGLSFTEYAGNPVIDLHKRDFRDPNVFWYEGPAGAAGSADAAGSLGSAGSADAAGSLGSAGSSGSAGSGQWIMAVSMTSEHQIRLYGSANLRDWKVLSDFGPAGYTGSGWECPSLMQLPVEGSPGVTKWVMMNSVGGGKRGVFMQYWVGDFDGTTFHNDNPADTVLPVDYGDCFYAAIPWNDAAHDGAGDARRGGSDDGPDAAAGDARRGGSGDGPNAALHDAVHGARVLVGWMIPGPQKTYPWTGQFSIPRDLSLRRTPAGYRLVQQPASVVVDAFDRLPASSRRTVASLVLEDREVALEGLRDNSWMLDATLAPSAGGVAGFKVGVGADGSGTVIGYDGHVLYVDRSRSGTAKIRPGAQRQVLEVGGDPVVRLQVLMDKGSLEIFVNGGEKVLTTYVYPEVGATGCSVFATGGKAVVENLKTWDLSKL